MKKWIIIGVIVILLGAAVGYASTFSLDTIEVNGCVFSSEKAVEEAVMANCRFNNTIELFLMNKFKEMPYVPFVSTVDLEFVNKNEVNVTVYEKAIAGCIGYMDGYVYFDNDGNVVYAPSATKADTENKTEAAFEPYRVRIRITNLNIRKGPGTNYGKTGQFTGAGVFTIVAESNGIGASKWGKLKSGAGWISLDYATKL